MFGGMTKYWISAFGAVCIGSLALTGYNANLGWCSEPQCFFIQYIRVLLFNVILTTYLNHVGQHGPTILF
jgi:hypothetical protein